MLDTKSLLNQLIIEDPLFEENDKKSLEELAKEYAEELSPLILAYAFRKTYQMIWSIAKKFFGITPEDLASIALEKLDFCLQSYDPDLAGKFSTYYTVILSNALRTHTQSLSADKRKIIFNSTSYEELVELGFDEEVEETSLGIDLHQYDLSDKEDAYCMLLIMQYSNAEISEIMKTSIMSLCNMRKRLRKKMIALQADSL